MTKVELVKGTVFEFDPKKTYLICFDSRSLSQNDFHQLVKELKIPKGSVAVMTNGDPHTAVKIIEASSEDVA